MNAPTPAQAAARRLQLAPLDRRTHEAKPYQERPQGVKLPKEVSGEIYRRIVQLRKNGKGRLEIAMTLGVSRRTVSNYLGRAGLPYVRGRPRK